MLTVYTLIDGGWNPEVRFADRLPLSYFEWWAWVELQWLFLRRGQADCLRRLEEPS